MTEEVSDIQEDFCIQLDEYPLLTKFSTEEVYKSIGFFNSFATLLPGGIYFYFRIELGVDDNIKVTPILSKEPSTGETNYNNDSILFSNYIKFQLTNSGVIPQLIELINLGNQLSMAFRVIAKSKRDFTSSFFNFHKDQSIFTFLQYYNFSQPFVFGTELLLGYKEDESFLPHELSAILPLPEKLGNLSTVYNTISKVNSELKDENINAVFLRGKYNNGDTMVFSDPLIRHATISSNEVIESNAIKISIPKKGKVGPDNVKEDSVRVCSEREPTTPEMVSNRQAIAMFIFIDTDDYTKYDPTKFGTPFTIDTPDGKAIKTVNFNKDSFKEFVIVLSSGIRCITIDGLNIKSRGGKRRRNTKKNKKTRRSRLRKRLTR